MLPLLELDVVSAEELVGRPKERPFAVGAADAVDVGFSSAAFTPLPTPKLNESLVVSLRPLEAKLLTGAAGLDAAVEAEELGFALVQQTHASAVASFGTKHS